MALFAESLGIAFQILDDILDITSDKDILGKPPGIDLKERKPSIVNLLWLESGSSLAKNLLNPPDANQDDFVKSALAEIISGPVIVQAKELAKEYAEKSKCNLSELKDIYSKPKTDPYFNHLETIIDFCLERVS